jgi:hypothetical protein
LKYQTKKVQKKVSKIDAIFNEVKSLQSVFLGDFSKDCDLSIYRAFCRHYCRLGNEEMAEFYLNNVKQILGK